MSVIEENFKIKDGSFLMLLHENSKFDVSLIMQIIEEIVRLTKASKTLKEEDTMELLLKLFFVFEKTTMYVIYHFDPQDLYSIKNLSDDYQFYLNRFSFSINMLLNKDFKSLIEYEDELGSLLLK